MAFIGRLLQIAGLILLPISMILQLSQRIDVRTMLLLLVMGFAAFYLGRIIEGYSKPR
ncbi:MAG: hypothetical protein IT427_08890 [Pirellulales bacterium]|nr:hypothetical protein [Pirellulales bacterium]